MEGYNQVGEGGSVRYDNIRTAVAAASKCGSVCQSVSELSLVSTSLSTSLLVLHRLQHVQSAAQKSECPPKVLET